jgi:hypothetical protein
MNFIKAKNNIICMTEKQIMEKLDSIKSELDFIKEHLVDDSILSDDDKLALEEAERDYREGKTTRLEDLEKELGM